MTSTDAKGNVITHRNLNLVRDSKLVNNRIYVGNLPNCTNDELESICKAYAKVLGSLVQKNFGFVQFESEEIANKVASALNKSTFKGNSITVRNAGAGQQAQAKRAAAPGGGPSTIGSFAGQTNTGGVGPLRNPEANDCEIIVINRDNTDYAESIEERLKTLNMRVDVLFPNSDVPLGKVLSSISARGCLYAVLITEQHEEHQSITVNILYGQPAEHRNMPLDDALKLLATDFGKILKKEKQVTVGTAAGSGLPAASNSAGYRAPPLKDCHPKAIQHMISQLSNNLPLTALQYERLIKYLTERRDMQLKVELGEEANNVTIIAAPDPEIELQKKILDILNKPPVTETRHDLLYENLDDIRADSRVVELLSDVRVQRALDSLMHTNLVNTVESLMKF